ncbi:hypothetical protein SBRY_20382 [Actinacidiphila bryophytorum]|uniref:Uncharacterized protein n=1 Tax=Actinacidiphila bryophytorum TaxID=1436133 RepID=A0A9W4E4K8_9ACTN|nr:hypothetical protein SBRY_20382 [Actinacidiphila bryophytorum]
MPGARGSARSAHGGGETQRHGKWQACGARPGRPGC